MKNLIIVFGLLSLTACSGNTEEKIPFIVDQQKGCELLPEFTLGYDTYLSDEQVTSLCSCVTGDMDAVHLEQAAMLAKGEDVTQFGSFDQGVFTNAMGRAIMGCQELVNFLGFNPSNINLDGLYAPWLITSSNTESLTPGEMQIYLNGYLETHYFIAYSQTNKEVPEQVQALNSIGECSRQTNKSPKWYGNYAWGLGRLLDKSLAHTYYETMTPLICKPYMNSGGEEMKRVEFYSKLDWINFSKREKAIYLAAYLDTAGAVHEKMSLMGYNTGYIVKHNQILRTLSVNEILTYIEQNGIDRDLPLPWSMAFGYGNAYKDINPDPVDLNP